MPAAKKAGEAMENSTSYSEFFNFVTHFLQIWKTMEKIVAIGFKICCTCFLKKQAILKKVFVHFLKKEIMK